MDDFGRNFTFQSPFTRVASSGSHTTARDSGARILTDGEMGPREGKHLSRASQLGTPELALVYPACCLQMRFFLKNLTFELFWIYRKIAKTVWRVPGSSVRGSPIADILFVVASAPMLVCY